MNTPGFTAEVSVYRTSARYCAMAGNALIDGKVAVPQSLALLKCLQGCHNADSPDYCVQHCYWNADIEGGGGGGGGVGGEPGCRPGCTPCIGGSKTCIRADCTEVEFSCGRPPRNEPIFD